jgi:hypothetical protein
MITGGYGMWNIVENMWETSEYPVGIPVLPRLDLTELFTDSHNTEAPLGGHYQAEHAKSET